MAEKTRPNYDSYSDTENAKHLTLRTPLGPKLIAGNSTTPPVLGNPALSTSKNLGKQNGHSQKHTHY